MEQTGALWRHAQLPQCSVEVVMSSMASLVSAAVPLAAAAASAALEAKACCCHHLRLTLTARTMLDSQQSQWQQSDCCL